MHPSTTAGSWVLLPPRLPAFARGHVACWCQCWRSPWLPSPLTQLRQRVPEGRAGWELAARRSPPTAACPGGCLTPCRGEPGQQLGLSPHRCDPPACPQVTALPKQPVRPIVLNRAAVPEEPGWQRGSQCLPVPLGLWRGQWMGMGMAALASPVSTGARAEPLVASAGPCCAGRGGRQRHQGPAGAVTQLLASSRSASRTSGSSCSSSSPSSHLLLPCASTSTTTGTAAPEVREPGQGCGHPAAWLCLGGCMRGRG